MFNKYQEVTKGSLQQGEMALEQNEEISQNSMTDFLGGRTREQCMLYFKVMLNKVFQLIEQHGQLSEDDIAAWTSFIYVSYILTSTAIFNFFRKFHLQAQA